MHPVSVSRSRSRVVGKAKTEYQYRSVSAVVQGRTIFLSDSAVVARRDGDLKFMFRIADIRPRYQVGMRCLLK